MLYETRFKWILPTLLLLAWIISACVVQPIAAPAPEPATPAGDVVAQMDSTVDALRSLVAARLQLQSEAVTVVAAEAVAWPDACLGAGGPAENCAAVITPGYRITLAVDGAEYVFHTDVGPYWLRLVQGPAVDVGMPVFTGSVTMDNGECQEVEIGEKGVAFGMCGGSARFGGKFVSPARAETLAIFAARYAPFSAQTAQGVITFAGSGDQEATLAEQEALAAWAQLVTMEAGSGVPMGGLGYNGPAEPGSSDTSKCATLTLGGGEATIFDCAGGVQSIKLNGSPLSTWLAIQDRFASFTLETATERLAFTGLGAESSEAWQRALLAWARTQYAQLSSGKVNAAGNTVLAWNLGPKEDDATRCRHLTVLAWGEAYAEERSCIGGEILDIATGWLETPELETLDAWLTSNAPLTAEQGYVAGSGTEAIAGQEENVAAWADSVWQRIWASTAQAATEQVSASGATVLAWDLGPIDDMEITCMHLTVIGGGEAYAETRPCEGGEVIDIVTGTLATEEQAQLDVWLASYAPLYAEQGYVAGTGTQAPGPAELADVEQWAAAVWLRLRGVATPQEIGTTPADCPAPSAGEEVFVNAADGYCVLLPAGYIAETTAAGNTSIVQGSIMNHVDPRVGIEVTDAGDRTLDEISEQFVAEYAPGFPVERSTTIVGGEDALVLDNLPGQDINRRVAVIRGDRLYSFFFTPLGEEGEARAAFESFYQGILDSFEFVE